MFDEVRGRAGPGCAAAAAAAAAAFAGELAGVSTTRAGAGRSVGVLERSSSSTTNSVVRLAVSAIRVGWADPALRTVSDEADDEDASIG